MDGPLIEQLVLLSSLGGEEVSLQLFTTEGVSKKAMLLTRDDAEHLRALQQIDLRFIRIGYDSEGNWLAVDLDNATLFFYEDGFVPTDVIRTPIETIMDWAPTSERLLLLTQRLNRGELSEQEFPRTRNTPTFEEMIEWISYVKAGVVTRENVSAWAGRVLDQSEEEMIERTVLDGLILLSGIDLLDNDDDYLHMEQDLDDWIKHLQRGMHQDAD